MVKISKISVFVLFLLLLCIPIFAIPPYLDQQGVLRYTANGTLMSGEQNFNLTIYNTSNDVMLYTENKTLTVSNGVWNYVVGYTTGIVPSIFIADTYFKTRINAEVLTSRNFTTVPYSFYSLVCNDTSYLGGLPASSYAGNASFNVSATGLLYILRSTANYSDGWINDSQLFNETLVISYLVNESDTNYSGCGDGEYGDGSGVCIDFNATVLDLTESVTYNATSIHTIEGTLDGGNLASIKTIDENWYNVSEDAGGSPSLIEINFTGVDSFSNILFRTRYVGGLGHEIEIQTWNYDSSSWESHGGITDQSTMTELVIDMLDPSDHISGGLVQLRFDHQQSGVATHDFFIDYVALQKGFTSITSAEHDSFLGRDNKLNHPWAMDTNATRNFTGNVYANPFLNITFYYMFANLNYSWIQNVPSFALTIDVVPRTTSNVTSQITAINTTDNALELIGVYINRTDQDIIDAINGSDVTVDCDMINFSGTIGSASICDGDDAAGGAAAGDKWVDLGTYIQPNSTFADNVVITGTLNASDIQINEETVCTSSNGFCNQTNINDLESYFDGNNTLVNDSSNAYADAKITLENTSMKTYVDYLNATEMTEYVDARDIIVNESSNVYADIRDVIVNDSCTIYTDVKITLENDSMKTYVDSVAADSVHPINYTTITNTTGALTVNETWLNTKWALLVDVYAYIAGNNTLVNDSSNAYADARDIIVNESSNVYADLRDVIVNNSCTAYTDATDILTNASLIPYIDARDVIYNGSMQDFCVDLNTTMKEYVDSVAADSVHPINYTTITNTTGSITVNETWLNTKWALLTDVKAWFTGNNTLVDEWIVSNRTAIHALTDAKITANITSENTTMKLYVDTQDTAQDECSEITGCIVAVYINLTEDDVEAYIFDNDNTATLNISGYNITGVDCLMGVSDVGGGKWCFT